MPDGLIPDYVSPQVIFDITIKLNGMLPAVAEGCLTDILFVDGRYRTATEVILVVTLAVEVSNKMLLERTGNAGWHVVIDV